MSLYRTNSVDEAVALAAQFKRNEDYDWFRGQVSNLPLKPSLARLEQQAREAAKEKIARFAGWIQQTPGLEVISESTDSILAIAQHYGLPTNFVDFTTNPAVAGFFASYGEPVEGVDSCIICLQKSDLDDFWESMPSRYPPPQFLRLEVPNLWRLEAQSGTFLFCPYDNIEQRLYDFDRIVFPYTGPVAQPTVEQMYPLRKSALEILLDQYFMNELLRRGTLGLEGLAPDNIVSISTPADGYDPDLIVGGTLPKHSSWDPTKLRLWLTTRPEGFSTTVTTEVFEIAVDESRDPGVTSQEISLSVRNLLLDNPGIRNKAISWSFLGDETLTADSSHSNSLAQSAARLWDGLRSLPYSDEDVAVGMGTCAALSMCRQKVISAGQDVWLETASSLFGDAVEVEFGIDDGSYSRGHLPPDELLNAVRDDIGAFLNPEYRDSLVRSMTGLLQAVQAPDRLFVFESLAKLFARRIAPIQVLVRPPGTAVLFSPARVTTFSLP